MRYFFQGVIVTVVLFVLFSCISAPQTLRAEIAPPTSPVEGTYSTSGGWGIVTLWQTDEGFEGTYTDTWQSDTGDIRLWIDGDQWVGEWEEPEIDRSGELYDITISDGGRKIEGLANVIRRGGHSPFEDAPFIWTLD